MKAVRFHEYGDPGVLRYEDVEQPRPGAGEALIRVAATSFNPVDTGIRGGYLRDPFPVTLPHTPGIEVSGTVEALGEGATGVSVGDAVVGFLSMVADGAAAEFVVSPVEVLVTAPSIVPLADAAALPMVGLTAWQALFEHGELASGQRVLVNGAGGAVGGYAVQLAKNAGAYVIATASPNSNERVRKAGADEVIDHSSTDVASAVTEPVDLVLNLARIEPSELTALAELARPGGTVVNSVPTLPTPPEFERGVRAITLFVHGDAGELSQLVDLVDGGKLHIDIAGRVPLAELAAVHTQFETSGVSGKVIVLPA